MATASEIHENLAKLGYNIRQSILAGQATYVRYCPGNGTAYDLLFQPAWKVRAVAAGPLVDPVLFKPDEGTVYLTRMGGNDGGYPWNWDHAPHVNYVAEKWARDRQADGAALVLLMAAISATEPSCTLEDADIYASDRVRA